MGIFIVIEGLDGCGKSEQIKRLHNYLFDLNKRNRILTTREPTYNKYGLQLREMLRTEKDPTSGAEKFLELFVKDRKEHVENVIIPFLQSQSGEDKNIVLCDRYYHSTYTFQQAQGIKFEKIYALNKDFLKPTITFILDVPAEVGLSRIKSDRNNSEKFENLNFMKKIRQYYLELPDKLAEDIVIVDGTKSKEKVFQSIVKILNSKRII